ncbi:hypothetical protein CC2G_012054 [Coprinopsis cinerea AmutBmut pab1-1]|nr:hypothetical protein CC2G_012054 [Coprinopsis cinerea AmutBmut pab1-1]
MRKKGANKEACTESPHPAGPNLAYDLQDPGIQVPQDPRKPAESDLRAKPKIDTRILEQTSKSRKLI